MNPPTLGIALLTLAMPATVQGQTLSTWAPWESDSAATAWLLQRHVYPNATFQSLPKGTPLDGLTVDVPTSPYRRTATATAFEAAARQHTIQTPCVARLTPLLRLLELAPWRKATSPEAEAFEARLVPLLPVEPTVGGLEKAFAVLDTFCQEETTP
jgi:hypothetical protein